MARSRPLPAHQQPLGCSTGDAAITVLQSGRGVMDAGTRATTFFSKGVWSTLVVHPKRAIDRASCVKAGLPADTSDEEDGIAAGAPSPLPPAPSAGEVQAFADANTYAVLCGMQHELTQHGSYNWCHVGVHLIPVRQSKDLKSLSSARWAIKRRGKILLFGKGLVLRR